MNCNLDKNTLRLFGLCVFYVLYLFFGAAIFSFFEYANEKKIISELKSKRAEFLQMHKDCLNGKCKFSLISAIHIENA